MNKLNVQSLLDQNVNLVGIGVGLGYADAGQLTTQLKI